MKSWLLVIVGAILTVWRWFVPSEKWVRKREQYRQRLKEIDRELEKVTIQLVQAKCDNHLVLAAGLDMERERLLKARHDCKRQYDYYERLCDKKD